MSNNAEVIEHLLTYINEHNAPGGAVFHNIKKKYPAICQTIAESQQGHNWQEKLYKYTHPDYIDTCKICKKSLKYANWGRGYGTYCSTACKKCDPDVQAKTKETWIQKYGVNNPLHYPDIRAAVKEKWLAKYGFDNPAKNQHIREKMAKTSQERYGVDNVACKNSPLRSQMETKRKSTLLNRYGVDNAFKIPHVREAIASTNISRYGVSHPWMSDIIQQKIRQTTRERYGTDYAMQNPEIMDKCIRHSKRSKSYTMPSGKIIKVQGFEPKALDLLLLEGVDESDIKHLRVDMPELWWVNPEDQIRHRYYPDFYIVSLNTLIEVKSEYTASINPSIICLKGQSVVDAGYQFRLMIF